MVAGFTSLRNFIDKICNIANARHFYSTHRRLSVVPRSRVMEQFSVRCVEGEERLQMCFNFSVAEKSRVFNLDRSKSEHLNLTLIRLAANIEKHFFKQKKKKQRGKKQVDGAANTEDEASQSQSNVEVYLTRDGEKIVPESVTNEEAWTDNTQVFINGTKFLVKLNLPNIKSLALPTCLMSDFPTYPKISSEFMTETETKWFKGKMRPTYDASKAVEAHHIESWTELHCGVQYIPTNEDIGHALKVECVPRRGESVGFMREVVGEKVVEAGPGFCPFEGRHVFTAEQTPDDCIRVVSYNILADIYADSDFSRTHLFPLCPPYALNMDYRIRLLHKEIKGYNADLLCLQEVDRKIFDHELLPTLAQLGYNGDMKEKEGEMPEGSAIFYRESKFRLVSRHDVCLITVLQEEEYNKDIWEKVQSCEKLKERVLERKTCLQVSLLECRTRPGQYVLAGTTHLYFHPNAAHIRVIQGALCVRHMEQVYSQLTQQGLDVAPVFCGDLNWGSQDGLMLYLIMNEMSENDPAWMSSGEEEYCGGMDLTHNLKFASACGFPLYTNYVVGFQGCLDYILADRSRFQVSQIVPMPSHEEVTLHGALPNIVFPSDHLALVCELKFMDLNTR